MNQSSTTIDPSTVQAVFFEEKVFHPTTMMMSFCWMSDEQQRYFTNYIYNAMVDPDSCMIMIESINSNNVIIVPV